MQMYKIDRLTGLLIEDVVMDFRPLPDEEEGNTVLVALPCPDGYYKACWDFVHEVWYEAATPEEIEAIKDSGQPEPTLAELWRADVENALVELANLIAGGE